MKKFVFPILFALLLANTMVFNSCTAVRLTKQEVYNAEFLAFEYGEALGRTEGSVTQCGVLQSLDMDKVKGFITIQSKALENFHKNCGLKP